MTATLLKSETHGGRDVLPRLSAIKPGEAWVVTCYLRITPDVRPRGLYLVDLKDRLRTARQILDASNQDRELREAAGRDLERIIAAVGSPKDLPPAPGLALFACESLGLLEVVPLPVIHRTRVVMDHVPRLGELIAAEQEFGRVITAMVDRATARIFEVTANGAAEIDDLTAGSTRGGKFHGVRGDSPGWGEKDYHNRIRRERERHYEAVSRRLLALDRERGARGLVVAGQDKDTAALTRFLDAGLVHRLIGTTRIDVSAATPSDVQHATHAVCVRAGRDAERAEIARMIEGEGEGWSVNGVQATMQALSRGQLRTLLVRADTEAAEADQAIEEALSQRVRVVMVHEADGRAVKHLAGVLRFR